MVPLRAVAVVLLVGLAGCGFGTPTATPTEPATPAPVPTTGEAAVIAPGVDTNGVYDPARLVDAHASVLANNSYTARLTSVRRLPNGSLQDRYDRRLRVADSERFHYTLRVTGTADRRVERWRAGPDAYEAVTENGNTTYRSLNEPAPPTLVSASELLRLFRFVPARVVDDADGTAVRLAGGPRDLPPLENVTYVATVTERGLVRSYTVKYTAVRDGQRTRVTVEATFSAIGETTVDRPSWYDEAT